MGLFRLKALLGGDYDSLSRPETTTLQRLRVRTEPEAMFTNHPFAPALPPQLVSTQVTVSQPAWRTA